MAKIKIPVQYLDGIEVINKLDDKNLKVLCDTLRNLPKGVGHKLFVRTVVDSLTIDNTEKLAETIFSFGSLLVNDEFEDVQALAKDICISFLQSSEVEFVQKDIQNLEDKIAIILNSSTNIRLTFQAYNIITSSQNVIVNSKINTDIRMVFDDKTQSIRNGLIFFNLNLTLQADEGSTTETFTLDQEDILKLKTQIESVLLEQENIKTKHKDVINFIDLTE